MIPTEMRHPALLAAIGVLACGGANHRATDPSSPAGWVILHVERVQVTPTHPGSDITWDPQGDSSGDGGCGLLGAVVELAAPGFGGVAGGLCSAGGGQAPEQDPRAPDIFISFRFGDVVYSSYVAPDQFDYKFSYRLLVPLDAIPGGGIEIQVLDKDDNAGTKTEMIGLVRVPRGDLVPGRRLTLDDAGVKKLEISIESAGTVKQDKPIVLNTADGMTLSGVIVPAGSWIAVRAEGTYRVGSYYDKDVDPLGYPGGGPKEYNLKAEPFKSAYHGAAIAAITTGDTAAGFVVGECMQVVTATSGEVSVGVNDNGPKNNMGEMRFEVLVNLPTLDAWRRPGVADDCAGD